jgi:hypothetical protein
MILDLFGNLKYIYATYLGLLSSKTGEGVIEFARRFDEEDWNSGFLISLRRNHNIKASVA